MPPPPLQMPWRRRPRALTVSSAPRTTSPTASPWWASPASPATATTRSCCPSPEATAVAWAWPITASPTRTSRTFFRTWTPPPVRLWSPTPSALWPPAAPPGRIWVWTWPSASSPPTPCSLTKSATVWSSSLRTAPPPASTALRRMSPTTPSPMPAPSRPPEPPSTPSASSPEPTPSAPAPSQAATSIRTAAP